MIDTHVYRAALSIRGADALPPAKRRAHRAMSSVAGTSS